MSEERIDHMKYLPQMENIGSEIQDKVISEMENYDPNKYTANRGSRIRTYACWIQNPEP